MIKVVQTKVFLQYGKVGDPIMSSMKVHESEAGQFVGLDAGSGGYPYATLIEYAHDFKTLEKALTYSGHFPGFHPRTVTITYEFTQHENLQKCKPCDGRGEKSEIVDHDHEYNAVWETRPCLSCGGTGKSEA